MNRRRFALLGAGLFGGLAAAPKLESQEASQRSGPDASLGRPYSMATYYSESDFLISTNNLHEHGIQMQSFTKQGSLIHAVYKKCYNFTPSK